MTYTPTHLKLWTKPRDYFGGAWPDYYVVAGRHRDSDLLTESNWAVTLERLGGEDDPAVIVVRCSHWAVGWVEFIGIHKDQGELLKLADELQEQLEDYPILDESHYSDLEWNTVTTYWERMGVRERVQYLQASGLPIWAARRTELPDDPDGALFERLRAD